MANLTKKLKTLAQNSQDQIHDELFDQFQSANFHRTMNSLREKDQMKSTQKQFKYEKA